jgi:uncharacterized protein YigE (DUF2233 family)
MIEAILLKIQQQKEFYSKSSRQGEGVERHGRKLFKISQK